MAATASPYLRPKAVARASTWEAGAGGREHGVKCSQHAQTKGKEGGQGFHLYGMEGLRAGTVLGGCQ